MNLLRCFVLVAAVVGASSSRLAAGLKPLFVPDELIIAFDVSPEAIGLRTQVEDALFNHAQVELIQALSGGVGSAVRLKPGTTFGTAFQAIQQFSFADYPGWALDYVQPNFLYWLSPPEVVRRLSNLSSRAEVRSGDKVMIGGCIIPGPLPQLVAINVRGASLEQFGVADALGDPKFTLYRGDQPILSNNSWVTLRAFERSLAGTLITLPDDPREPMYVTYLDPGAYTAVVSSEDGGTGVALLEFYLLDQFYVD